MTEKQEKNSKKLTESDYPQFEVWQPSGSPARSWSLNIKRNAGQKPIEIRELPSLGAVKKLIQGFLEQSDTGKPGPE